MGRVTPRYETFYIIIFDDFFSYKIPFNETVKLTLISQINEIEVPCTSSQSTDTENQIRLLIAEGNPSQLEMVTSLQQFFKPFPQKSPNADNKATSVENGPSAKIIKDEKQKTLESINKALLSLVEIEKKKVTELEKISSAVSAYLEQIKFVSRSDDEY